MKYLRIIDGEEILPIQLGEKPVTITCGDKSISMYTASNSIRHMLLDETPHVHVLPTISEDSTFRDLDDGPEDLSQFQHLEVAECKKQFPLRLNRKPKRRLPYPVEKNVEPRESFTRPWAVLPDPESITVLVGAEKLESEEFEAPILIRWQDYPIITKDEIKEYYKKYPRNRPNNEDNLEDDLLSGNYDFKNSKASIQRREPPEKSFDELQYFYEQCNEKKELFAKFKELVVNPKMPEYQQKQIEKLRDSMLEGTIPDNLEVPRIEGTYVGKEWLPWKVSNQEPRGKGRRGKAMFRPFEVRMLIRKELEKRILKSGGTQKDIDALDKDRDDYSSPFGSYRGGDQGGFRGGFRGGHGGGFRPRYGGDYEGDIRDPSFYANKPPVFGTRSGELGTGSAGWVGGNDRAPQTNILGGDLGTGTLGFGGLNSQTTSDSSENKTARIEFGYRGFGRFGKEFQLRGRDRGYEDRSWRSEGGDLEAGSTGDAGRGRSWGSEGSREGMNPFFRGRGLVGGAGWGGWGRSRGRGFGGRGGLRGGVGRGRGLGRGGGVGRGQGDADAYDDWMDG